MTRRLLGGVATVILAVAILGGSSPCVGNSAETENTIAEAGEKDVSGLGEAHDGELAALANPRQAEPARRT